jgi:hypothetical protein
MRNFVEKLLSGSNINAREILEQKIRGLIDEKLNQIKVRMTTEMYDEIGVEVDFVTEDILDEANVQKMGRTKLIRLRIRGGKIQRRKKLSAVKGYTIRGGKMIRMSAQERRHRKMAARRSKFKRRAKLRQSLRKRKLSLRRRKAMGL